MVRLASERPGEVVDERSRTRFICLTVGGVTPAPLSSLLAGGRFAMTSSTKPAAPATPIAPANGGVLALRDKIKTAPIKKEVHRVDAWGIEIEFRGMMLGARSRLMRDGYAGESTTPIYDVFYPLLLAYGCFNPVDGQPIFGVVPEDGTQYQKFLDELKPFINGLDPAPVDFVAKHLMRLSGLSKADVTEKNDGPGAAKPSSITSSSSPSS